MKEEVLWWRKPRQLIAVGADVGTRFKQRWWVQRCRAEQPPLLGDQSLGVLTMEQWGVTEESLGGKIREVGGFGQKEVWGGRFEELRRFGVGWCSAWLLGAKRVGCLVCTVKFCEGLIWNGYVELEITMNGVFEVVRTVGCGAVREGTTYVQGCQTKRDGKSLTGCVGIAMGHHSGILALILVWDGEHKGLLYHPISFSKGTCLFPYHQGHQSLSGGLQEACKCN